MKTLLVAFALSLALPAWAQSEMKSELPASSQDRPWAKGVSPERQKAADELFRQGNDLLRESLFVQAATKYREALRRWDHPGIHYNLALALLNLDRPVEVFGELEEAMKYGDAPLDPDKFAHAKRYRALIEQQLARVTISCQSPGASVSMDGQPLFTAPGRYESLVRVGQHTIVATKAGFEPTQKTPILFAGQKETVALTVYTAEDLTQYRRRWANALPWSVLAAGVAVAAVGGILHWQAADSISRYDRGVSTCGAASGNGGCMPDATLASQKSTGDSLQAAAYAFYGVGAAAIAIGGVLAYLNRAKPYHVEPDKVSWTPVVGAAGGGVSATVHF
jgi:tetratricopeptide (TPR) repeat protein